MAITEIQYKSTIQKGVEYIVIEGRYYPYAEIAKAREIRRLQEQMEYLNNDLNQLREKKITDNNGQLTYEGMLFRDTLS